MTIDIICVQIILGILLFFIINWIGKHSYSIGYISISIFVRAEEAPAFNYIIRVLTPIVYLILAATALYALNLDKYVVNFYFVNLYYIIFRLIFNLFTGRGLLLNWYRQVLYWASIMLFSYITYKKIIFSKTNILPDFTTIANELWIIILVFLFHLVNKIELPQEGTIRRKEKYLEEVYYKFKRIYGDIIESKFQNNRLKALAYSILIYENFNRPKLARYIENLKFRLTGKPHTLGVMQFYTNKMISDYESVELGTDKILNTSNRHIKEYNEGKKDGYYNDWQLISDIISDYNSGEKYQSGVNELHTLIEDKFYNNDIESLIKPKGEK
ncbi:MAG: hypothetical protein COW65_17020 [Cytophagales bacterium CG18_big_fil_WC_8_21_14_2_50_42_9]|nr:MAG: hypothetical protein COW65_17020 [Cytophagales bacterium CG18_big_fil_WC_8_21_14_2_50_42_9]